MVSIIFKQVSWGMIKFLVSLKTCVFPSGLIIVVNMGQVYIINNIKLGYILNNGCSGVFFNDSTKIIMDPNGKIFQYKDRKPNDKYDLSSNHTIDFYPEELKKKVILLQHFRSYL